MRKVIYLLVLGALFTNCESKVVLKKVDTKVEKELINTVLNVWHKSAAEANYETYFNAMTNEGVFIGTDASENEFPWICSVLKEDSTVKQTTLFILRAERPSCRLPPVTVLL